ncbi:MAG: hypothetical protein EOP42_08510 [Sphingobacteriaceae bacterium]|nr:MAG: hypothetical protein EOP42_08510 [Sphingobacteriaceae bacterium]
MKKAYLILLSVMVLFAAACNQSPKIRISKKNKRRQPVNYANYVIEVITYKIKKGVNEAEYTRLDSIVQQRYTQKQPGYISNESGKDQNGNWLVVLSWDNAAHADADQKAFKTNALWTKVQQIIDTNTIDRKRFFVKDDHSSSLKDKKPYVIELATFKEKPQVKRDTFEKRDLQVEADYISRQSGYITRRIGVADNGQRLMMIFWETLPDADNGMKDFMKEESIADYNKMIDWKTVALKRFEAIR